MCAHRNVFSFNLTPQSLFCSPHVCTPLSGGEKTVFYYTEYIYLFGQNLSPSFSLSAIFSAVATAFPPTGQLSPLYFSSETPSLAASAVLSLGTLPTPPRVPHHLLRSPHKYGNTSHVAWALTFFLACPLCGHSFTLIVVQVAKSCLTLCNPMDCSTPGFPVLHRLLELAQTHVH